MGMGIYTSRGTISVRCSLSNSNRQDIFFVPHDDYHIKHRNKTFAVFMPQSCNCTPQSCNCTPQSCNCTPQSCNCTPQYCNKAIIRECDRDKSNGVKIRVDASTCTEIISGAAVHQKKVEVWVKPTLKERSATEDKCRSTEVVEKAKKVEKATEALDKATEALDKANKEKVEEATEALDKAKEEVEEAVQKLMKVVEEQWSELRLTGITVPAK